jgi:hypothetical protein
MPYTSDEEIEVIISQFENRTLPKSLWTHQAHLTVGMHYLYHHHFFEALCYMKSNIIIYNVASGGVNTAAGGYHETLTVFWLKILEKFLNERRDQPLFKICNAFLESPLAKKDLPTTYYTKEKLFSVEARSMWVEPDTINQY